MAILFISFLPTVIVATLIQTRVARQDGWSAIRKKPFLEMYWKNVTPLERFLFWPGLIMFLLTMFGATVWKLVQSVH